MQNLTCTTMAEFSIKRLFSTKLVLYASTVTAAFVERLEVRIVRVDFVGDAEFPFVMFAFYFFVFAALSLGLVLLGLRRCHFGKRLEDEGSNSELID